MNPRAITYRRLHDIPAAWGTAVNVQAMVFGNMGEDCATGVCFTRDPSTGENMFYGEYLVNAQGEDVVAGIRTPQPLSMAAARDGEVALEAAMPAAYAELMAVRQTLEKHYRDMQDIEFTVQRHKLFMLQTRNGKRTAAASLRMAVEMAHEGLIDQIRGGAPGQSRPRWINCCTRCWIRRRRAPCSPRACRPVPVPRAARWCSARMRPKAAR